MSNIIEVITDEEDEEDDYYDDYDYEIENEEEDNETDDVEEMGEVSQTFLNSQKVVSQNSAHEIAYLKDNIIISLLFF